MCQNARNVFALLPDWFSLPTRCRVGAHERWTVRMLRLPVIAAALVLSLAAAGAGETGLQIDRAWARATPGSATTGAAYFRIRSPIDDRLISLASPVAAKAELHTHIEENGMMQMRAVEGGLPVKANEPLELSPRGKLHVMLVDLKVKLKVGDRFPLTLTFEKAGAREVSVRVERLGAMGPSEDADVRGGDAALRAVAQSVERPQS
jgi:periplasmic copper chaperone A